MDSENAEENKLDENDEQALPQPTIDELKEQLDEAIAQRDEYLGGWQRSKADFMNHKKEEAKKMEEMAQYGSINLIRDLIPVLDNFDLAVRALEKAGSVDKGIYLIKGQVEDVLKRRGVEKISVKPGDDFDPSIAEALAEIDSDHPPGTIVEEIEPGYRLHEKVIKPARVITSKHKE